MKVVVKESKRDTTNALDVLSIINLVFCSVFFIIGIASLVLSGLEFFDGYIRNSEYVVDVLRVEIHTYCFVSFFMAMLLEAVSSVLSVVLLAHSNRKAINIVSFGISAGLLTLTGIFAFFAGI